MLNTSDRERIFGTESVPKSGYCWCLHCERAYKYGEYRMVRGLQMCPYDGCDGDTVIDAEPWEHVRERKKDYPKTPEMNKKYSAE